MAEQIFPFPRDVPMTFTASGWELFRAKLFGEKIEDRSGPWVMRAYYWRGKLYVTNYSRSTGGMRGE